MMNQDYLDLVSDNTDEVNQGKPNFIIFTNSRIKHNPRNNDSFSSSQISNNNVAGGGRLVGEPRSTPSPLEYLGRNQSIDDVLGERRRMVRRGVREEDTISSNSN